MGGEGPAYIHYLGMNKLCNHRNMTYKIPDLSGNRIRRVPLMDEHAKAYPGQIRTLRLDDLAVLILEGDFAHHVLVANAIRGITILALNCWELPRMGDWKGKPILWDFQAASREQPKR